MRYGMDLPTKSTQFKSNSLKAGKHEGACSCSTPLQHASGATLPRLHQRFLAKNMLRNKTFAPEFCSLISYQTGLIWGSKLQGQICCTSLFQKQAPSCVLKFACREMTCLQLANQIGLFFSSTSHCELTFKMAAEEVEEDSVQIIDNKKTKKLHGVSQIQD